MYLFIGAPFDKNYQNVYYTNSNNGVLNYLQENCTQALHSTNNSYIHIYGKNECYIHCLHDLGISQVNYCVFRNPNHENRYFYGFVDCIEYVNDNTIKVIYTIDVFSSYFYSVNLRSCYVTRCHTTSDNFGENLQPEPNFCKDFRVTGKVPLFPEKEYVIRCYMNPDTEEYGYTIWTDGEIKTTIDFCYTDRQQFVDKLMDITTKGKVYTILDCFLRPKGEITAIVPKQTTINGYTPKNNKCFVGDYNRVVLSNNCGATKKLFYERSTSDNNNIDLGIVIPYTSEQAMMMCYPKNYNNSATDYDSGLVYWKFPHFAIPSVDYYEYMAKHGNSYWQDINNTTVNTITAEVSSGIGAIGSAASGNIGGTLNGAMGTISSAVSGISQLKSYEAKLQDLQAQGVSINGSAGGGGEINLRTGQFGYTAYIEQACYSQIKAQDEYFSRYGYAQNTIMTPNITARPYYTYIQTQGCSAVGACPASAIDIINKVFDRGVTVWKAGIVGNFNVDNSI